MVVSAFLLGCGVGTDPLPGSSLGTSSQALASGGLVRIDMNTTVGVLLDEIPAGSLRDSAAATVLAQPDSYWLERAQKQVALTNYRLVFRSGYCAKSDPNCGSLPLPPTSVQKFELTSSPKRGKVGTHDYVKVDYHYYSYLVTDAASIAAAEPALANVGGNWSEPFKLPADPELVFQRTGYACMDELEFPPGSVFEESPAYFFDQTCGVETPATSSCHVTEFPSESCVESLRNHVGMITPGMVFTRVAYDPTIAAAYRVGSIVNHDGADLATVTEALTQEEDIYIRYFDASSCEVFEGTVATPGWHRLLTFSTNVRNDGTQPIHIGDVTDPTNPYQKAHDYEFSTCHNHYHFTHYANFGYNGTQGNKRAFCLEDTNRYHNDETTSLIGVHQTCNFQGVQQGWGDEYQYGLSGQWVDITNTDASSPHALTEQINPDQFLCEGETLNINNQPVDPTNLSALVFDPSPFKDSQGNVQGRVRCSFPSNWAADNTASAQISSPAGSFINLPCARGQTGPLRDCDYDVNHTLHACTPGSTVTLQCHTSGSSSILRVCERSAALGGTACTYRNTVANQIIDGAGETVSFTCPAERDSSNGAGGYSVYRAPLLPSQVDDDITCTGW